MHRHLIALAGALTMLACAAPALAQTVTSPVRLVDGDGVPPIVVSKAATSPAVAKGTRLYDCGSIASPFIYAVGSATGCPAPIAASAPAMPRLVTPATFTGSTKFIGAGARGNMVATNVGALFRVKAGALVEGATFADIAATGSTYLFRAYNWNDVLRGATIQRVSFVGGGAGFLTFRGAASNILIEDVTVKATVANTECGKVPEGIGFSGKNVGDAGAGITIRRVHIEGIRSTGCSFLNGDGLAIERGYSAILVQDAYFGWNSDAGVDVKSSTARLERVTSEGNRRGFKMWADQRHGRLTCINNGQPGSGAASCIQIQGARTISIDELVVRQDTIVVPILQAENTKGAKVDVTIGRCGLQVPAGTPLVSNTKLFVLHLGPGCAISAAR